MRSMLTLFSILTLFLPSVLLSLEYSEAQQISKQQNKPLLLFFSGSDWSGLSMKMKNEILDSNGFKKRAASNFIFVEIDFPQHEELSSEISQQNEELKKRFSVTEYPSLVLVDSEEREIFRLGYVPESGVQLANDLERIISQDKELCLGLEQLPDETESLQKLYQIAQELGRNQAIHQILDFGVKAKKPYFLLEKYRLLVEDGQMDTEEANFIRDQLSKDQDLNIHFTIALIDFQELSAQEQDPVKAIKPLKDYLARFGKQDCDNVWCVEMMIAQYFLDRDEWKSACKYAELAYQSAPEEIRKEIKHALDYIRAQSEQIASK